MIVRLKKISMMSLAKVLCGLHACVGFLLGLFVTLTTVLGQGDGPPTAFGAWSVLAFPIINAALGFCLGIFIAGAYNAFSSMFGGIEYETEQS